MSLWLLALAALTMLRLALAGLVPLAPDEAYYFMWSRHLQPGYFDHPPMVALWIRAGTALFGDTPFGIRFFGPVSAALGSLLIADAGEKIFPGRGVGLRAAVLLNATLMVGAGAILMTPDTPLMFFWTAGIAASARLLASGKRRWWAAVGLAAGLAMFSKYTAVLFIAAVFIWVVTAPEGRAWLRRPWPWGAAVLAALIFAPDFWWNAAHHWASYIRQGSRVTQFDIGRSLQFFAEFCIGQFFLFTPGIFLLALLGTWRLRRLPATGAWLLILLTIVPGAVFLEHVISDRVQNNWAAILYPSACLAAAAMGERWFRPAALLGFALTGLVYAQAVERIFPIPPDADPVALQLAGWRGFAAQAAAGDPAFLTSDDYATASALAYYAPPAIPVAGFDTKWQTRWRYFAWPSAKLQGKTGILVTRHPDANCPEVVGSITRMQGGRPVMTYRLCRVTEKQPGVLMPRP